MKTTEENNYEREGRKRKNREKGLEGERNVKMRRRIKNRIRKQRARCKKKRREENKLKM